MSKFLPSASDWRTWFKIEQQVQATFRSNLGFQIMSQREFRILAALVGQLIDVRLTTKQELIEELSRSTFNRFSESEYLGGEVSDQRIEKMISRDLTRMGSPKRNLVAVYKLSTYRKSHLEEIENGPLRFAHGNIFLVRPTGAGVIAYECLLTTPLMAMTVAGVREGYSIGDSIINIGIASRPHRLKWHESFFAGAETYVREHNEPVFGEIKKLLGKSYSLFWKMASAETLLLRELGAMKWIIESTSSSLRMWEHMKVNRRVEMTHDMRKYQEQGETNYEVSLKLKIELANLLNEKYLIPEWKKLGHSEQEIVSHCPPSDFFYNPDSDWVQRGSNIAILKEIDKFAEKAAREAKRESKKRKRASKNPTGSI